MPTPFYSPTRAVFKVTEEDLRPNGEPHPNDAAHDELVDWLSQLDQLWEGDSSGLVFYQDAEGNPTERPYIHFPGQWVEATREDTTAPWRFIPLA